MASMTFLQIVQRAFRESGIAGSTGPTAVTGQVGRNAQFVEWARTAYEDVQMERNDWRFMWGQAEYSLAPSTQFYDPVVDWGITAGVSDWARNGVYVYDTAQGVAMRQFITFLPWADFQYLPAANTPGWPNVWTIKPDGDIGYYPVPPVLPATLKAVHQRRVKPSGFSATDGTDVPILPVEYHMILVWATVIQYAQFNKDWSLEDSAREKYKKIYDNMIDTETPDVETPGALA
jgi:hypothetical protein